MEGVGAGGGGGGGGGVQTETTARNSHLPHFELKGLRE